MTTTRDRLQRRLISMSTPAQSTIAYHGYRARLLPDDLSSTAEALVQQGYEAGYLDAVQAVQRLLEESGKDEEEPPADSHSSASDDLPRDRGAGQDGGTRGSLTGVPLPADPDRVWCAPRYEFVVPVTCVSNCGAPESRTVCWGPGR